MTRKQASRLPGATAGNARYGVGTLLGSGYYADVFEVQELPTDARWAAKVYPARNASRAAARREVDALRALSHRRMPSLHDSFEELGLTWVIMDLVPGPDLRAEVETRGSLDVLAALRIGAEACELLAYCGSRGWTYRDLHPRNIHRWTPVGVMLVDFDGARPAGAPGESGGRIGYHAPEVAHSVEVHPTCDVFALAGCMYFAVTGKDPPAEPGALGLADAAPSLSSASADILLRCRNPDPKARPHAEPLRLALREEIARVGIG